MPTDSIAHRFLIASFVFALATILFAHADGQEKIGDKPDRENGLNCVLNSAVNGATISVRGKVWQEPHDMAFGIEGCKETVLLTYVGDYDNDVGVAALAKDQKLARFRKYTSSTYPSKGPHLCMDCPKYGEVKAELTGVLGIASIPAGATKDPRGFIHDSSGKIIGTFGWGHPIPFAKYRLIIESVQSVSAQKLPRP